MLAQVKELDDGLDQAAGQEFVYNPWKLKELRRLYVSLTDGTKVGYLDLGTMESFPEPGTHAETLHRALAGLTPVTAARRFIDAARSGEGPEMPAPAVPVLPWTDLAANPPGHLIAGQDDPSYRAGLAGEQRTAGVLAPLEKAGYRVLHSLPLSPRKDLDHLVIGPSGVWAINTKSSTYKVTARADGSAYSDGYRQKWVDSIVRDAGVAAERLSAAARMDLQCRPLVAAWSTMAVSSSCAELVEAATLGRTIAAPGDGFPPEWVDVVYNVARRSDTWTVRL